MAKRTFKDITESLNTFFEDTKMKQSAENLSSPDEAQKQGILSFLGYDKINNLTENNVGNPTTFQSKVADQTTFQSTVVIEHMPETTFQSKVENDPPFQSKVVENSKTTFQSKVVDEHMPKTTIQSKVVEEPTKKYEEKIFSNENILEYVFYINRLQGMTPACKKFLIWILEKKAMKVYFSYSETSNEIGLSSKTMRAIINELLQYKFVDVNTERGRGSFLSWVSDELTTFQSKVGKEEEEDIYIYKTSSISKTNSTNFEVPQKELYCYSNVAVCHKLDINKFSIKALDLMRDMLIEKRLKDLAYLTVLTQKSLKEKSRPAGLFLFFAKNEKFKEDLTPEIIEKTDELIGCFEDMFETQLEDLSKKRLSEIYTTVTGIPLLYEVPKETMIKKIQEKLNGYDIIANYLFPKPRR
jgi:hypothetical protein